MMNIGRLDRKITIEERTPSANTTGEVEFTWSTYTTLWAEVMPVRGNDRFEQMRNTNTTVKRFKVRYTSGLDESMRVVYNSQNYDILEIAELDREGLIITAERKL